MVRIGYSRLAANLVVCAASVCVAGYPICAQDHSPSVCRPVLGVSPVIELGKSGVFAWGCSGVQGESGGYYIVFVRPSGTYVLLKVPKGKTSFEFTADSGVRGDGS